MKTAWQFKVTSSFAIATAAHIMEVQEELKLKRIISAQKANLSKSSISKAAASAQLKICQLGREEAKLSINADEL